MIRGLPGRPCSTASSARVPGSSRQSTRNPPGAMRSTNCWNTAVYASAVPWWSRWSGSRLVITAPCGEKARKEPSDSSASATKMSPLPWCAPEPDSLSSPPMANDGSSPAACSATVSIEVVDVLPWVPAMHTLRVSVINAASAYARCNTGSPRRRASRSSGLVERMAVEITTAVGPSGSRSRFSARWPTAVSTPRWVSPVSTWEPLASEPDTGRPRSARMRAMALIPAPPMPIRCTRASDVPSAATGAPAVVPEDASPVLIAAPARRRARPWPPSRPRCASNWFRPHRTSSPAPADPSPASRCGRG